MAEEIRELSRNISMSIGNSMGEFRRASEEHNKNITKIIKDLGTSILSQKKQIAGLSESIEEVASSSHDMASKMDQMNNHLLESINIQSNMLAEMKNVFGGIANLGSQLTTATGSKGIFGQIYDGIKNVAAVGAGVAGAWGLSKLTESVDKGGQTVGSAKGQEGYKEIYEAAKKAGDKFPEITASQWALESSWGKRESGKHNVFGQKAKAGEDGTMRWTTENINGQNIRIQDKFKDYGSIDEAVAEHVKKWSSKYAGASSAAEAAQILKSKGYATDPDYVSKIMSIVRGQSNVVKNSTVAKSQNNQESAPKLTGAVTTAPPPTNEKKQATPAVPPPSPVPPPPPSSTPAPPPAAATPAAEPPPATGGESNAGRHNGIITGGAKDAQKQNTDQNGLTTLQTRSGHSYQVASKYAEKFKGFVDELEATGYKIRSIGGYANRNIAGTNTKSWHAQGMAIDINPDANPVTYRGQPGAGKNDLPSNVSAMAAKYGLGWGGNWNHKLDTMHFSFGPNEGGQGSGSSGVTSGPSAGSGSEQTGNPAGGSGGSGGQQQPDATPEQMHGLSLIQMATGAYQEGSGGASGLSGIMGGLGGLGSFAGAIAPSLPGMASAKLNEMANIPAPQPVMEPERPVHIEQPSSPVAANTIEQDALQKQIEEHKFRQQTIESNKINIQRNAEISERQQYEGQSIPGIDYNGPHDQEVISKWAERLGFGGSYFKEFEKIKLF